MAEVTIKDLNNETLDMLRAVTVWLQRSPNDPTAMHNAVALLSASVTNLFQLINKQTEQHDIVVENIRALTKNNQLIIDSLQLLAGNFVNLASITIPKPDEEASDEKPTSNFETKY